MRAGPDPRESRRSPPRPAAVIALTSADRYARCAAGQSSSCRPDAGANRQLRTDVSGERDVASRARHRSPSTKRVIVLARATRRRVKAHRIGYRRCDPSPPPSQGATRLERVRFKGGADRDCEHHAAPGRANSPKLMIRRPVGQEDAVTTGRPNLLIPRGPRPRARARAPAPEPPWPGSGGRAAPSRTWFALAAQHDRTPTQAMLVCSTGTVKQPQIERRAGLRLLKRVDELVQKRVDPDTQLAAGLPHGKRDPRRARKMLTPPFARAFA